MAQCQWVGALQPKAEISARNPEGFARPVPQVPRACHSSVRSGAAFEGGAGVPRRSWAPGRSPIVSVASLGSPAVGAQEDETILEDVPRPHSRSHGEVDSDRHFGRVRLLPPTLEETMQTVADRPEVPTAIRTHLGAIFVLLELSRSTWLITSLSPGGGEKMSKQVVRGGDVAGLLERFARLREKARARTGKVFPFVVIQEAGLDGFWIDRALQNEGIESHVVDPASIATSRRRRRAKTDWIDGEALVRALLAFKRGEPRVCAMVKAPIPEEEDPAASAASARC